jgi:hypothetical protein
VRRSTTTSIVSDSPVGSNGRLDPAGDLVAWDGDRAGDDRASADDDASGAFVGVEPGGSDATGEHAATMIPVTTRRITSTRIGRC